jgi:hypothetical protein
LLVAGRLAWPSWPSGPRTERAGLPAQVDVETLVTMRANMHEDDLARFLN